MNTFEQMTQRGHEQVSFHHDARTGLRAIIAVHSTALGPGFGGVRRWHYATEADALYDVLRLSEGMTYKAAAAGIPIGGGKGVIMLPRPGEPAKEPEARAMGRFVQDLGGRYIAAEDVGLSPQYVDWMARETQWVTGGDETGSGGDPSPHTSAGVVNAMRASLVHMGRPDDFSGVRVAIQGAGNVGTNVARILQPLGAEILIADISPERVAHVVDTYGATAVAPEEILTTPCDILAPCALGAVITSKIVRKLRCSIICGGANNVLGDYDEDGAALQSSGIVYVPDFIANAGGVIELAGLYVGMTDTDRRQRIEDITATVRAILLEASSHPSTYAAAVAFARRRIAEGIRDAVPAG